jgi:hypothetical protein
MNQQKATQPMENMITSKIRTVNRTTLHRLKNSNKNLTVILNVFERHQDI